MNNGIEVVEVFAPDRQEAVAQVLAGDLELAPVMLNAWDKALIKAGFPVKRRADPTDGEGKTVKLENNNG